MTYRRSIFATIAIVLCLSLAAYAEAERNVVMAIEGMNCELCPLAIKKSLEGIKGVRSVEVSFEENKAWLSVDESVTDQTLIEAVQKAGPYSGRIMGKESIEEPERRHK